MTIVAYLAWFIKLSRYMTPTKNDAIDKQAPMPFVSFAVGSRSPTMSN